MQKTYKVQQWSEATQKYRTITGAQGNKSFCLGWFYGMQCYYPSPRIRVVDDQDNVLEEHFGNGRPRV